MVKVAGQEVRLPDALPEKRILLARATASCFRQGVSLFKAKDGSSDRCLPDSSKELTGAMACVLDADQPFDYLFVGVPESLPAHEECINRRWLQVCN